MSRTRARCPECRQIQHVPVDAEQYPNHDRRRMVRGESRVERCSGSGWLIEASDLEPLPRAEGFDTHPLPALTPEQRERLGLPAPRDLDELRAMVRTEPAPADWEPCTPPACPPLEEFPPLEGLGPTTAHGSGPYGEPRFACAVHGIVYPSYAEADRCCSVPAPAAPEPDQEGKPHG